MQNLHNPPRKYGEKSLAAFISIASVAMITSIGTGVNSVYTATNTQVQAAATAAS